MRRVTSFAVIVTVLTIAISVPLTGTAVADANHGADIETETLTSGTTETIKVSVTNPENNDNNIVSPLIEVQLRSGLSVASTNITTRGGRDFLEDDSGNSLATVENESNLDERRRAYIDSSTIRGGDAVFIEGVEVPVGETRTYSVPIDISGTSDITIEADTRPLNNVTNNNLTQNVISPVLTGTMSVDTGAEDVSARITGTDDSISRTVSGAQDLTLPSGESYNATAELDSVGQVSINQSQLPTLGSQTILFNNPSSAGTIGPTVVARTGGTATILDASQSRDTTRGNATTKTTQTVTFDISNSGQTVVAVGEQSDLPMNRVSGSTGTSDLTFNNGVAQLEPSGTGTSTVSITFEGRKLGNVDNDADVDDDDAREIADNVAADSVDDLTDYADITDSGSISAVDAMQVQQYEDDNRDGDYTIIGGN